MEVNMRKGLLVLFGVLGLLLAATIFYAAAGLQQEGPPMSADFYAALFIGAALSVTVGVALMALVFFSSRRGYDEPPKLLPQQPQQDTGSERQRGVGVTFHSQFRSAD
jgi:hypothetical protein